MNELSETFYVERANPNNTNNSDQGIHYALKQELIAGLSGDKKYINPKFFYDQRGSELFEQITQLPEYYPARTEKGILENNSREIADTIGRGNVLLEPGAGSCEKVRLLLDELKPSAYLPMDISADFLQQSADKLRDNYPWLSIFPIEADFSDALTLPEDAGTDDINIFYPGSTIGNFEPVKAKAFLQRVASLIGDNGGLLIGVDLQKETRVLHDAYNDSQGVTAAFNRNVIRHVNEILDAEFDIDDFKHCAFYNDEEHRIEMHLECLRDQEVVCDDATITLQAGERIHTENSYKYTLPGFSELVQSVGLKHEASWTDDNALFAVQYFSG